MKLNKYLTTEHVVLDGQQRQRQGQRAYMQQATTELRCLTANTHVVVEKKHVRQLR